MKSVKIAPINRVGDSRTGTLTDLTKKDIVRILGFEPNCKDDPDKVKYSWGFTVNGIRCGVWSYKGSHRYEEWSTFGPIEALELVFGDHVYGA